MVIHKRPVSSGAVNDGSRLVKNNPKKKGKVRMRSLREQQHFKPNLILIIRNCGGIKLNQQQIREFAKIKSRCFQ
jgi:hypothetical protein